MKLAVIGVVVVLAEILVATANLSEEDDAVLLQHGRRIKKTDVADLSRVATNKKSTSHADAAIARMKAKIGGRRVQDLTPDQRGAAINEVKDSITCPYCKTLVVSFGLDVPVLERAGAVTQEEYRNAMVETGALPYAQFVGGDAFFETSKHHHECDGVGEVGTVNLLTMDQNITLEHGWSSGIVDIDGAPSRERLDILFQYADSNGRIGAEELIAANNEFHSIVFGPDGEITTGADMQGESGFNGAFPDWNTAFALMLGAFGTEFRTHSTNPFEGTGLESQFPEKLWNATLTWSREDMRRLVFKGKPPRGWVKREWDATDPDSRQTPTLDDHSVWKKQPRVPGASFWQTVLGVFGGSGSTSVNGPLGNRPYPICVTSETPWASNDVDVPTLRR